MLTDDADPRIQRGPRLRPVSGPDDPRPMTKRTLLLMSHAMEQAFDAVDDDVPGLVVGLFQRREYFDVEANRYAELARAGHTVLVAFTGSVDGLPPGVHGTQLAADDPRSEEWVLILLRGDYATSLAATDRHESSGDEATLQGSRTFDASWTFRRRFAAEHARAVLSELCPDLPTTLAEQALAHVARTDSIPVSDVEARLAIAAEHLVRALEVGGRHNTRLRRELAASTALAELDQLTGLSNRHYLERFLGDQDTPADLLAMLVDVDDLKTVNDSFGHAAGDAVLAAVARVLRECSRVGDVVVRWGGDEFMVLIPDPGMTSAASLLALGERLAVAVAATHPEPPWDGLSISVSIGISPAPRTRLPLPQLDAALYEVKRDGKGHAGLPPALAAHPSRVG